MHLENGLERCPCHSGKRPKTGELGQPHVEHKGPKRTAAGQLSLGHSPSPVPTPGPLSGLAQTMPPGAGMPPLPSQWPPGVSSQQVPWAWVQTSWTVTWLPGAASPRARSRFPGVPFQFRNLIHELLSSPGRFSELWIMPPSLQRPRRLMMAPFPAAPSLGPAHSRHSVSAAERCRAALLRPRNVLRIRLFLA